MTSQKITEKKLRKIISKILKEQGEGGAELGTGGGVVYDTTGMYSSGGRMFLPGYIKAKHFADVWQSVKDVFSTAAGATKEVLQKFFTLLKVAIAGAIGFIIPVIEVDYEKIRKEEEDEIQKIRDEYKDVTDRVNAAVGDSDILTLAFLSNPGALLTGYLLYKTPDLVGGILGSLTDDERVKRRYFGSKRRRAESKNITASLLEEADDEKSELPKMIKDKKIIQSTLESSKKVDDIKKKAIEIYQNFLQKIYSEAQEKLTSAKSIEDLKKMTDGKFKGIELSGKEKEKFEKLSNEDKAKMEEQLVNSVRNSIKDLYVKKLQDRISEVLNFGIQSDSNFVVDHQKVIEKIKAL